MKKKAVVFFLVCSVVVSVFTGCQATKDYGKAIGGSAKKLGTGIGHSFKEAFK